MNHSVKRDWTAPFFTIWTGQAFSLFGSQLVQFALVWWLTKTTDSATVLATATLIAMLPQIILGPVAGTLVDRWDRRRVMIAADGAIALATVVLVVLFATDRAEVWHVYAIMLVRSAGGAFHWPAMQASTSLMVPEAHLARVAGLNSALSGGVNIVAPPLGALLLDVLAVQGVLAIDIVTASIAIATLLIISIPQPVRRESSQITVWGDLRAGLQYVRNWPGLMIILGMAALINFLLIPSGALLPLLVRDQFNGEALAFGSLQSVIGIGALSGGLLLGAWGGFRRKLVTSMTGLLGVGLGHIVLGLAPGSLFVLALIGVFVAGLSHPIAYGPLYAVIQAAVAPEMQGRVFTLLSSISAIMSPLSLAVAGPLSDAFGVRFWYVLAGIVAMTMGVSGYFIPALMQMEDRGQMGHPVQQQAVAVEH